MNRLFKEGVVTTAIGVVIILIAVMVWAFGNTSALEVTTIAGVGFIFLRSKDSLIGISPKKDDELDQEQP